MYTAVSIHSMALAPKDWPLRLPVLPRDFAKCGICHDFAFELGSTAKEAWDNRREVLAYYWAWELYGPHCQFCKVILEVFWHIATSLGYTKPIPHEDFRYLYIRVVFHEDVVTLCVQPPSPSVLTIKWANQAWNLSLADQGLCVMPPQLALCSLCLVEALPWSHLPIDSRDPGSVEKAAVSISQWIQQCIGEHPSDRCRSSSGSPPTRLIQIDKNTGDFQLVEKFEGLDVQYTALSYCWGGDPEQETVEKNYYQRLHGYNFDGIPRLLTDAIRLTAACGFYFIWIDALCIIQDRDADRIRELSLLTDTYANAVFTISAAHAKDVHQTLVAPQKDFVYIQNHFARGSDPTRIQARKAPVHDPIGIPVEGLSRPWPAFTRAWTFQERLISSRVVHFAPDELIWECTSCITCECGDMPYRESYKWMLDRLFETEYHHSFLIFWRCLVEGFTQRTLSRDSDRLVTMSGVAERFARYANGRAGAYIAGIWGSDMIHGISWFVRAGTGVHRTRPSSWVAPSWSWASLKSEVTYSQSNPELCKYHSEVGEVECPPRSRVNPFGEVQDGFLVLKGPCLDMVFDVNDSKRPLRISMDSSGTSQEVECELQWDIPLNRRDAEAVDADQIRLILLWSSWPKRPETGYFKFMIVKSARSKTDSWVRVGMVEVHPRKGHQEEMENLEQWTQTLPMATLRII